MRTEKTALIVGAGEFTNRGLDKSFDMVIAADAGLTKLNDNNITPDVIIGDFDSLGFAPDGPDVISLPIEKDLTDLEAAMRRAWDSGCRNMLLYGVTGGNRIDHFLGNLQLGAEYSRRGAKVRMVAPDYSVYFLTNGEITLHGHTGTIFSVLSHTIKSEGVSILGDAKYRIYGSCLENKGTLGISNEMQGNTITVSVKKGTLIILIYES